MSLTKKIHNDISKYYSGKIERYGLTPLGVDWNSVESQEIRFEQLAKVILKENFSLLDYGCGYGAMYTYLEKKYQRFSYTGFDISGKMRSAAGQYLKDKPDTDVVDQAGAESSYDYAVASGIFNVKLKSSEADWMKYINGTLRNINKLAVSGFSFNLLTAHSDKHLMRRDLFYADPTILFDFCKKEFSRNVALLHDYNLYEFTIIVRKEL